MFSLLAGEPSSRSRDEESASSTSLLPRSGQPTHHSRRNGSPDSSYGGPHASVALGRASPPAPGNHVCFASTSGSFRPDGDNEAHEPESPLKVLHRGLEAWGNTLPGTRSSPGASPPMSSHTSRCMSPVAKDRASGPGSLASIKSTGEEVEMRVQGLQARVKSLERNLASLMVGDCGPSPASRQFDSDVLRKEIMDSVQSERHVLREKLAAEIKEAMKKAEIVLERQLSQIARDAVADAGVGPGTAVGGGGEGLPERLQALEQRLERQLSADTATLAGVLARCQELSQDLQTEKDSRSKMRLELRELEGRFGKLDENASAPVGSAGRMGSAILNDQTPSVNELKTALNHMDSATAEAMKDLEGRLEGQLKKEREAVEDVIARYQELSAAQICATWDESCANLKRDVQAALQELKVACQELDCQIRDERQARCSQGAELRTDLERKMKLDVATEAQTLEMKLRAAIEEVGARCEDLDNEVQATLADLKKEMQDATKELEGRLRSEGNSVSASSLALNLQEERNMRDAGFADMRLELTTRCQELIDAMQSEQLARCEGMSELRTDLVKELQDRASEAENKMTGSLERSLTEMQRSLTSQLEATEQRAEQKHQSHRALIVQGHENQQALEQRHHTLQQEMQQALSEASAKMMAQLSDDLKALDGIASQCQDMVLQGLQKEQDARSADVLQIRADMAKELRDLEQKSTATAQQKGQEVAATVISEIDALKDAAEAGITAAADLRKAVQGDLAKSEQDFRTRIDVMREECLRFAADECQRQIQGSGGEEFRQELAQLRGETQRLQEGLNAEGDMRTAGAEELQRLVGCELQDHCARLEQQHKEFCAQLEQQNHAHREEVAHNVRSVQISAKEHGAQLEQHRAHSAQLEQWHAAQREELTQLAQSVRSVQMAAEEHLEKLEQQHRNLEQQSHAHREEHLGKLGQLHKDLEQQHQVHREEVAQSVRSVQKATEEHFGKLVEQQALHQTELEQKHHTHCEEMLQNIRSVQLAGEAQQQQVMSAKSQLDTMSGRCEGLVEGAIKVERDAREKAIAGALLECRELVSHSLRQERESWSSTLQEKSSELVQTVDARLRESLQGTTSSEEITKCQRAQDELNYGLTAKVGALQDYIAQAADTLKADMHNFKQSCANLHRELSVYLEEQQQQHSEYVASQLREVHLSAEESAKRHAGTENALKELHNNVAEVSMQCHGMIQRSVQEEKDDRAAVLRTCESRVVEIAQAKVQELCGSLMEEIGALKDAAEAGIEAAAGLRKETKKHHHEFEEHFRTDLRATVAKLVKVEDQQQLKVDVFQTVEAVQSQVDLLQERCQHVQDSLKHLESTGVADAREELKALHCSLASLEERHHAHGNTLATHVKDWQSKAEQHERALELVSNQVNSSTTKPEELSEVSNKWAAAEVRFKSMVEGASAAQASFAERCTLLEQQFSAQQASVGTLQAAQASFTERCTLLEQRFSAQQASVDKFQEAQASFAERLEQQVTAQQASVNKFQGAQASFAERCNVLEQQFSVQKTSVDKFQDRMEHVAQSIHEAEVRHGAVRDTVARELQKLGTSLEQRVAQIKDEMETKLSSAVGSEVQEASKDTVSRCQKLSEELQQSWDSRCMKMTQDLQHAAEALEALSATTAQTRRELQAEREERESMVGAVRRELGSKHGRDTSELEKLRLGIESDLQEIHSCVTAITQDAAAVRKELAEVQTQSVQGVARLASSIDTLVERNDKVAMDVASLDERFTSHKEEHNTRSAEVSAGIAGLSERITAHKEEHAAWSAEVAKDTSEMKASLEASVNGITGRCYELSEALIGIEQRQTSHRALVLNDIKQLEERHLAKQQDSDVAGSQVEKLRSEWTSSLHDLDQRLGNAVDKVKERCQQLAQDLQVDQQVRTAMIADVNAEIIKQVQEVENGWQLRLATHKDALAEETAGRQRAIQEIRDSFLSVESRLASSVDAANSRLDECVQEIRAEADARCAGTSELRTDLMREVQEIETCAEKKRTSLCNTVMSEIVRMQQSCESRLQDTAQICADLREKHTALASEMQGTKAAQQDIAQALQSDTDSFSVALQALREELRSKTSDVAGATRQRALDVQGHEDHIQKADEIRGLVQQVRAELEQKLAKSSDALKETSARCDQTELKVQELSRELHLDRQGVTALKEAEKARTQESAELRAAVEEARNLFKQESQEMQAAVMATSRLVATLREDTEKRRGDGVGSGGGANPSGGQVTLAMYDMLSSRVFDVQGDVHAEREARTSAVTNLRNDMDKLSDSINAEARINAEERELRVVGIADLRNDLARERSEADRHAEKLHVTLREVIQEKVGTLQDAVKRDQVALQDLTQRCQDLEERQLQACDAAQLRTAAVDRPVPDARDSVAVPDSKTTLPSAQETNSLRDIADFVKALDRRLGEEKEARLLAVAQLRGEVTRCNQAPPQEVACERASLPGSASMPPPPGQHPGNPVGFTPLAQMRAVSAIKHTSMEQQVALFAQGSRGTTTVPSSGNLVHQIQANAAAMAWPPTSR